MPRIGRGGVDGVKNRSEKCEGPGRGGGTNGCLKRKVFLKNQKHQPNIVEITHLCIMHRVHTNIFLKAAQSLLGCCLLFKWLFLTEWTQVNQQPPLDACYYSVVDELQLS